MPINEFLQRERIRRNWRQRDVADTLGVSILTIHRWERGFQSPSAYYRGKLCALFELGPQELGFAPTLSQALEEETSVALQAEAVFPSATFPPEEIAIWMIPYARNPHFTGRERFFEQLERQFSSQIPDLQSGGQQVVLTRVQVLKGLGGSGKTQIAIEYAYRAREQGCYAHTFWINAVSEETIVAGFLVLAELLSIECMQQDADHHEIVATVLRGLERCEQPWLLIFDNADDLSLVNAFIPLRGKGCILLTTRSNATGSLTSSMEVSTMDVMEGVQFLLRRTQHTLPAEASEIEEATNIVVALAQFPLAIDQAGAYIEETACSLQDYFQIYHQHRYALLARRGKHMGYPESVATIWSLSFQRVEAAHPAAAEFLRLCALLAPDQIPEELLMDGSAYWPPTLQQTVVDRWQFNQLLEVLLAFSLIKRIGRTRQLSLHRLVQVVQLDRMSPEEQRQWAERVVRAVHALSPCDPHNAAIWPTCLRYRAQVEACETLIQHYQLHFPESTELLERAGRYHIEQYKR
ncbi:hypothetical protein KDA_54190 [Dictyobacter alpinus]|uniref:HTH cro/C1-type domain-containing protein n=1 Tax=Dictyobacter alpinus TaxID=2014873 RepID=A0A402BEZ2_9CHLR|nr:helix-turn-helix transcriptional regulator [Dictyobacter alpinus]GCE29935.1 hypothetical protein KDA_54190 [Dictyobacter alpinus]